MRFGVFTAVNTEVDVFWDAV